jgi:hypothetical protein
MARKNLSDGKEDITNQLAHLRNGECPRVALMIFIALRAIGLQQVVPYVSAKTYGRSKRKLRTAPNVVIAPSV